MESHAKMMDTHHAEIVTEIERRRVDLNLALLKVYNYYRVFIGLSLLAVGSQTAFATQLGSVEPVLFFWLAVGYTATNLASALAIHVVPWRQFSGQLASLALVLFDVTALAVLMYCSGGVTSGIPALILVTVAAGAIIMTGRISTLVAALASIALLYEEFYLSLAEPVFTGDFFQAGIYGGLYFASSLAIQWLSTRLRANDIRALTQAVELADLERVNRLIIQRMRTGIILVDQYDQIRMTNQSSRALIGKGQADDLTRLPPRLQLALTEWRNDSSQRTLPFQVDHNTPEIRVNFSAVRSNDPAGEVTIFIEDTGEVQMQAQQLKLAALGRLSASIAHEIRNPLGAISHAAQLLKESSNLDRGDAKLTQIIHNHCIRMNGVIENVLEMSRRNPPAPVRLNLLAHVTDFARSFEEAVPEAEMDIVVDPQDAEIRIDPSQLNQALTNLVQNGIHYSVENGNSHYVRLEGGVDHVTERPYLNVIDRGPGVAEDHVESLFEPFHSTSTGGTGLGLYISRELCEANQARLTYLPHADGGSCFRILFAHPDRIVA